MHTLLTIIFSALTIMLLTPNVASPQVNGLTGYYHGGAAQDMALITGPYDYKTVDPRIDFGATTWSWTPFEMKEQFSVYWNGWLYIDKKRPYSFGILANGGAELYIDDIKVVDKSDWRSRQWASGFIPLDSGYHRIELIYFNWHGSAGIVLYWDQDSGFAIIPSGKLFPEDAVNPETGAAAQNLVENFPESARRSLKIVSYMNDIPL